ncbi:hypothetical protein [Agrobacterium pusense]|jgi:hypothetical protein|uniref:hypothetical protein n=1 Tax=Agrobacterium pusense TaxID=648995 RepID=UPI00245337BA|nr:hypothetical protein [Agrobacterium pusense]
MRSSLGIDTSLSADGAKLIGATRFSSPRFPLAIAFYCETMSKPVPEGWPIWKLMNQFSRYFAAYTLIHNYFNWRNGGPDLPTLAQLQTRSGLSSRQTINLVSALKVGRLIEVERFADDRRINLLRPSSEIILEIGRSILAFIEADDLLRDRPPVTDQLKLRPELLGEVICLSGRFIRKHGTLIQPFPRVLSLASRDCGYLLLVTVMASHYRQLDGKIPIPLSNKALAKRYEISSSHVANVLRDLKIAGDLEVDRNGRLVRVSSDLVAEFEGWGATQMAHFSALADQVLSG